ncbi:hypothetical protein ACFV0Y_14000, partial [Streptomyces sp. NPDC059569]|uniref:hypothetical protein n=1 Tax=Streptomyces sp. NPDC059569 TaxID=3346869 RepID=UPI0036A33BB3
MSSIESGGGAGAPKTARLSAGETWRALYRHFRPHRRIVALGAFLALIGAGGGGGRAAPPPPAGAADSAVGWWARSVVWVA